MTAPVLLLAFALAVGGLAGPLLDRTTWPSRSPRLGIWVWVALSTATVTAAILAAIALAVPSLHLNPALADLLHGCWASVLAHYSTTSGALTGATGLVAAVGLTARLLHRLVAESLAARRLRQRHRQAVLLLGHPDPTAGVLVLPDRTPAAYCLPGRPGLVVCTSAALDDLRADELQAVLAHERAHLEGRHHHLLTRATALRSAFPFVPTFRLMQENLAALVEMRADDVARAASSPRVLAVALLKFAGATTPRVALGASGAGLVARVHRLAWKGGLRYRAAAAAAALGLAVLATPVLIALGFPPVHDCPPEVSG